MLVAFMLDDLNWQKNVTALNQYSDFSVDKKDNDNAYSASGCWWWGS